MYDSSVEKSTVLSCGNAREYMNIAEMIMAEICGYSGIMADWRWDNG